MKIRHRVGPPRDPAPPAPAELDDRYLAELEATRRKAEKRWNAAQRALARAEERCKTRPDEEARAARAAAAAVLSAREDELAEIEMLMRAPSGRPRRIAQRSGQQDRLELGRYEDSKRTGRRGNAKKKDRGG